MLAACDMGCDVTVAFPEGWDLDDEVMAAARERLAFARLISTERRLRSSLDKSPPVMTRSTSIGSSLSFMRAR